MSEKKSKDKYDPPNDDADYGLPEVNITALKVAGSKEGNTPIAANTAAGKVENPKPKEKKKGNNSVFILLLLLLLLLLGGYGVYHYNIFGIRDPADMATTETEVTPTVPDATLEPEPEPEIEPPVVVVPEQEEEIKLTEITSRIDSPRYFLVAGSFIDDDLARDYSNRLNKNGMSTFLIHPYGNINFYRLSIGEFDNLERAISEMETIQEDFEENLWVLKY